jgi:hypothetical protein
MGGLRSSSADWAKYSTSTSTKSTAQIFTSSSLHPDLNPKGVTRESRDSDANSESTAILVGVDVTGSMGMISETLVRTGLGTLFTEIYERRPVSDPHIAVAGIGDAYCDRAPFQISQFEADLAIADQLEKVYVESGGGGNGYESYELPMYFAAYHTSIDCMEKRNKRGYLFTIGDEPPPPCVRADQVNSIFGDTLEADIPMADIIDKAQEMYYVYHLIVKEGSHCRYGYDDVKSKWTNLLGERAVTLTDYTALAEVIVSIIEVNEGRAADEVVASWSGSTALAVSCAVMDLAVTSDGGATAAVTRF